uniref:NADH-ubiquinone oxidoreductase chain 6 n=1 Tax=Psilotreta sp. XG-2021 TaxID=2996739 RepID=A0A9E8LQ53_9NEOP|nr:NADH dehydrogenase subunit 6 [Psilotreta sp. XG-2021]
MFLSKLLIFMSMISILMIFMHMPLLMNLTLIFQIILVSLILSTLNKNFWFSYILFLIFIGGLMILFLYITSLINNKLNLLKLKILFFQFLVLALFTSMIYWNFEMMMNIFFKNNNMTSMNLWDLMMTYNINENELILNKIFNKMSSFLTFILMNYLLLTMIISIKIINLHEGPLRTKKL